MHRNPERLLYSLSTRKASGGKPSARVRRFFLSFCVFVFGFLSGCNVPAFKNDSYESLSHGQQQGSPLPGEDLAASTFEEAFGGISEQSQQ